MKFIIEKNNLLENLNNVSKAITGKSTNPILQGIKIQVQQGTILMFGSDMDLSIAAFGKCEVIEEGSMLVDAKMFIEIIRKLPKGDITISLNEDDLIEIASGKSLFNIVHMKENEYPEFPKETNGTEVIVSKKKFRTMIGQVGYAISLDDSRPILKGILCEVNDSILKLVALDGYRIAYSSSKVDTSVNMNVVVDGKSLINISRLISDEGTMKLYLHKNHIEFRLDNMVVYSRLLEGKYIAYEQLFPKDEKLTITCNRIEFLEVIERSSLIAKDPAILKFKLDKDGMIDIFEVTAKSTKGKGREELPITIIKQECEDLEIAFNGRYLLEMAKNIESENMTIKFKSPVTPVTCSPADNEDCKFVVLPIRLTVEK